MAKRTREHVVGDIASNKVQLVFLQADWVVNTIPSDYGEDLLVSPTRNENVDTFHLLVQVKGKDTEVKELQDGKWSRSFEATHIERWIRMREPVAVVLWSLKEDRGRYCMPREQHNLSELLATVRAHKEKRTESDQTVTLHFNEENALTESNLTRLAWEFRLAYAADTSENYRAAYYEAINNMNEAELSRSLLSRGRGKDQSGKHMAELKEAEDKTRTEWYERLDEVLQTLGVLVAPGKIHNDLISEWSYEKQRFPDPDPEMSTDEIHAHFCIFWLDRWVKDKIGVTIYSILAESLADRILRLWPSDEEVETGPGRGSGGE